MFLAPFISRPFSTALFIISHREEVEASTQTNFSGLFSSLPFPTYLIPSSLSSLPSSSFRSFLQFRSVTPLRDLNGRRRKKRRRRRRRPGGVQDSRRCSTFQSTRFSASERRMHRYWIAADPADRRARESFRPSELTPLLFFCDE